MKIARIYVDKAGLPYVGGAPGLGVEPDDQSLGDPVAVYGA